MNGCASFLKRGVKSRSFLNPGINERVRKVLEKEFGIMINKKIFCVLAKNQR